VLAPLLARELALERQQRRMALEHRDRAEDEAEADRDHSA
jgi:hypothetical protein